MDNEIMLYTAAYSSTRLAILAALAFALFRLVRPAGKKAEDTPVRPSARRRVYDDRGRRLLPDFTADTSQS